jgi:hypothetical protein
MTILNTATTDRAGRVTGAEVRTTIEAADTPDEVMHGLYQLLDGDGLIATTYCAQSKIMYLRFVKGADLNAVAAKVGAVAGIKICIEL